jgi:hypothetical protein
MRFRFRFEADGHFLVTGIADDSQAREVYRLNGEYEIRRKNFTSQAISKGRPVRLLREGDDLWFVIDQTLELRLSRLSPFAAEAK